MNCYQCVDCGEKWYSAARLEYLFTGRTCDNCGGELKLAKTIKCENERIVIERDEAGMTRYFPEVASSED